MSSPSTCFRGAHVEGDLLRRIVGEVDVLSLRAHKAPMSPAPTRTPAPKEPSTVPSYSLAFAAGTTSYSGPVVTL